MPLDLGNQEIDIVARIFDARCKRRVGRARAPDFEVAGKPDDGKTEKDESLGEGIAAALCRGCVHGIRHGLVTLTARLVSAGDRQKAAADFGARVVGILGRNQSCGLVPFQFPELIAVNRGLPFIIAGCAGRSPHQRREQNDGNNDRQQSGDDPEQHETQLRQGRVLSNCETPPDGKLRRLAARILYVAITRPALTQVKGEPQLCAIRR